MAETEKSIEKEGSTWRNFFREVLHGATEFFI
jgi:hypothetical protein